MAFRRKDGDLSKRRNHRRRLLQFGGSASRPITLISAPAGYGKTTLLRQWVADIAPVIRLDPAEITDYWQLWQQVSRCAQSSGRHVDPRRLHLLERTVAPARSGIAPGRRHPPLCHRNRSDRSSRCTRLGWPARRWSSGPRTGFDEDETRLFLTANHIAECRTGTGAMGAYRGLASRAQALHTPCLRQPISTMPSRPCCTAYRGRQLSDGTGSRLHRRRSSGLPAQDVCQRVS